MPIPVFDPFYSNEVQILFAVMNPGVDNGPWDPYSPKDFLASDVYSYAGGEGVARLYFYACSGGMMATKGFGPGNELIFLPLVDNTWSNIKISYNYGYDVFTLYQNDNVMYSGSLISTFSPSWTIDNTSATLRVYTGTQYAIDELQRKLIPLPPLP